MTNWQQDETKRSTYIYWPVRRFIGLVLLMSLLAGVLGAGLVYRVLDTQIVASIAHTTDEHKPVTVTPISILTFEEQIALLDSEKNTISVVESALPGVVLIKTSGTVTYNNNDLYWYFYGGRNSTVPISGNGSGFIYDLQGHVVTNFHVIENMDKIEIDLFNGKTYTANVIGSDQYSDLAVLKIDAPASELTALPLADSDLVQVGQKAIAIGSPLASSNTRMGLEKSPTVTQGIVSAKDRTMPIDGGYGNSVFDIEGLIQTDAAINPGNSGGPLLNSSGEVIGVNTAIISSAQGIGFAVPSSIVQKNVATLIQGQKIGRPKMGVDVYSLDATKRQLEAKFSLLDLPTDQGSLIMQVEKGSPADKAGLRGGSVIISVDGMRFVTGGDIIIQIDDANITGENLTSVMRKYNPGDEITLLILRDGKEMEVKMVLGAQEE